MSKKISINGMRAKITILSFLIAIVTAFHFLIPTEPHSYHKIHIVLRKLYFLPPVVAAAWFGLRGALYTTITISTFFAGHIILDWPGNYMEQSNQIGELVSFWMVGLIPGYLFDRQRSLMESLSRANEETLLTLVSALDMRERNTRLHSQRVRGYTLLLADRFGLDEERKRNIGFGALLHDMGKIGVPDSILLKPGSLRGEEWQEIRKHPEAGYDIVKGISFLKESAEVVYDHHEHFDGSGYPRGLKGEEIPIGARLFAVVDAYDALTSERPYHTPLTHEEAVVRIQDKSGIYFDPAVVESFLSIDPRELETVKKDIEKG